MDSYKVTRNTEIKKDKMRIEFEEIKQAWIRANGYAPIEIYKRFISYVLFGRSDTKDESEQTTVEKYYNDFINVGELVVSESGEFAIFID